MIGAHKLPHRILALICVHQSLDLFAFQMINLALWAAAFAIGLAVVYGLNIPERSALPPNNVPTTPAIDIAYGGLHRFSWAVAVSWVIFACCRGYGGES